MKTIKRNSTDETNVSARQVWYDGYKDGVYIKSFDDINDALDWKESE